VLATARNLLCHLQHGPQADTSWPSSHLLFRLNLRRCRIVGREARRVSRRSRRLGCATDIYPEVFFGARPRRRTDCRLSTPFYLPFWVHFQSRTRQTNPPKARIWVRFAETYIGPAFPSELWGTRPACRRIGLPSVLATADSPVVARASRPWPFDRPLYGRVSPFLFLSKTIPPTIPLSECDVQKKAAHLGKVRRRVCETPLLFAAIRPGFHFRRRFRRAVGVQPLGNLFVGLARAAYPAYLSPWPKRATKRSELPMLSKK
jgi:hypothetical protein